jgi:putative addiction module component (TIGR02574 family)
MSTSIDQLKATLSGLPAAERAELAEYLLHSLDADEDQVTREWLVLAEDRMADVRAGHVVGIPAEEVINSLLGPGR